MSPGISQFVSAYTQMQAQIRGITPASSVKEASNEVAENFFNTLIVQNNWAIPDIHQIGLFDGGAAATSYFNGDFAPWSGTPLFALLGDDSFTKQLLLTTTPFTDPNANETKLVGGTYDLVSAAELLVNLTTLLVAAQAALSSDFPTIAEIGAASALEAALATQEFFNTVYGSGVSSISIGNDLFGQISPLIAPTGKYQVGTLAGEDVTLGSSTQVFVGGTGNDNVSLNTVAGDTSTLYPIRVIDGGLGTNTLHDNAPFDLSVTLETLSRSDQTTTYGEAPNWRADITADEPAFNDYVYDFNTIDLGSGNDTVIFGQNVSPSNLTGPDGSTQLQSLDGGSGVNTLDLTGDAENIHLVISPQSSRLPGASSISATLSTEGTTASDLALTNFQDFLLGAGDDTITLDPSVSASTKLMINGGGGNNVFNTGGGTEILIGGSGTNDFKIDSDSENPKSIIIWGGGGTSTYDFSKITSSPTALYGYTVVVLNVENPTAEKLMEINPQDILNQYTPQILSITEVDGNLSNKNIIVLVNPGANDSINYDGESIAVAPNLSASTPFGAPGYIDKNNAASFDYIDTNPGAPHESLIFYCDLG